MKINFARLGKIAIIILIFLIILYLLKMPASICNMFGGEWGQLDRGMFIEICYMPYSTANNECNDSNQCDGWCVVKDINSTKGRCQISGLKRGCFFSIDEGTVSKTCIR
jgi:hypothetical protein